MRIGELAQATGVPQRMLRYYEQQGLLGPERSVNGYRQYTGADVGLVGKIRRLIEAGMPTRLIRVVLEMEQDGGSWTPECSRDFAEELAAELSSIDARIECLRTSRDTVRSFLERTGHAALIAE
ncbi:MAG TPA: MerR family transcriptional regulator [Actinomycetales bacterium]|nr:MerR family transcriptional regulator [Actinomycetales bacterium]